MNQECGKRIYGAPDSAQSSMEFWDYTVELECMQGQDDLQLAAEIGKRLLERNRELEIIIRGQQASLDDQSLRLEHFAKQANEARELSEARQRICEQLETTVAEFERTNHALRRELRDEKHRSRSLSETVSSLETRTEEVVPRWEPDLPRLTPPPTVRRRRSEPPWKLSRQLRLERQASKEYVNSATMTDDLFDDERTEVEALEASFLRELDRRLGNSESEIERLQEEIGLLLIRLAESEGRARDEAEQRAEVEEKVEELTKLLTSLTTPPDPRRLDEREVVTLEQANEMSLEEEFRLSGDFDDVSSGIQSDLDTSLTTRDVSPDFDDRKVTAWNPCVNTNDNTHTRYFNSNYLLHSQGTTEEEPLSILFSTISSDCLSCCKLARTPSNFSNNLRSELKRELLKQENDSKQAERRENHYKQKLSKRENENSTTDVCLIKEPAVQEAFSVEEYMECIEDKETRADTITCDVKLEEVKVQVPTDTDSQTRSVKIDLENDECDEKEPARTCTSGMKKKNKKRRKRICNRVFYNPKLVEQVPEREEQVPNHPSEEEEGYGTLSAISRPFRDFFGVCRVVGSVALCYFFKSCLELGHSEHNPIGDFAPPLLLVNDSLLIVGN